MAVEAPSIEGLTMSAASAVMPKPISSARIGAPRLGVL